ncbi:MAG: hypothetical protein AAGD04_05565 [Pseudomonadota bacterium]
MIRILLASAAINAASVVPSQALNVDMSLPYLVFPSEVQTPAPQSTKADAEPVLIPVQD